MEHERGILYYSVASDIVTDLLSEFLYTIFMKVVVLGSYPTSNLYPCPHPLESPILPPPKNLHWSRSMSLCCHDRHRNRARYIRSHLRIRRPSLGFIMV